jgi:hypothetical protein
MTSSYLNIVTFLLTTWLYYFTIKPTLTYDIFTDPIQSKSYIKNNYMFIAIYVMLIIVIQFIVNAQIISSTCGGNITDNMAAAGIYTFIPWTLIFGAVILVISINPGFKTAFSDVIGYFYVSNSANKVLTELLVNREVQSKIDGDENLSLEKKEQMQTTADTIIKIFGNTSLLINQIVPNNFNDYWETLKPLMKGKYQPESDLSKEIKNKLFNLVVSRDNVGEAMWFLYTGILLTSIVQMKLTARGCSNNASTMEKNYQVFLDQENTSQSKQQLATSSTYTITG